MRRNITVLSVLIVIVLITSGCGLRLTNPPPPNPLAVARVSLPESAWDVLVVPEYDGNDRWIAFIRIEMPEDDLDAWLQQEGFPTSEQLEEGQDYTEAVALDHRLFCWDIGRRGRTGTRFAGTIEQDGYGFTRYLTVAWTGWGVIVYLVAFDA